MKCKKVVNYICGECRRHYKTEKTAQKCCSTLIACDICGAKHKYAKDAEKCCIYKICPFCQKQHKTKEDVDICCIDELSKSNLNVLSLNIDYNYDAFPPTKKFEIENPKKTPTPPIKFSSLSVKYPLPETSLKNSSM